MVPLGGELSVSTDRPRRVRDREHPAGGAYVLWLQLKRAVRLHVGSLGRVRLLAGNYAYVGSARRGIAARIARHRRLANAGSGAPHWHVDYLLLHPAVRLLGAESFEQTHECVLSRRIAAAPGTSVPMPGFGATDCRAGCGAHLYRVETDPAPGSVRGTGTAVQRRRTPWIASGHQVSGLHNSGCIGVRHFFYCRPRPSPELPHIAACLVWEN